MSFKTASPVRIAYEKAGSGPLVVFLHGIGGNRTNWQHQLSYFARRFCAVAWDARGYGDSDDPPTILRFSDFADDLCVLLDHLRAEKAHCVGMSMGGMILQDFYGRYPDRVATLALVDTASGFAFWPQSEIDGFVSKRLQPLEEGKTFADLAPGLVEVLVAPQASVDARRQLQSSLESLRVEPYKQAVRAIVTTDYRSILPRITVPTVVIVGDQDRVTPVAMSDELTAAIPGAEEIVLEGSGHLTNVEVPDAFNAALAGFLDGRAERASRVA
jgi:pimeloyl-ACP methyl ester carboxylesterase